MKHTLIIRNEAIKQHVAKIIWSIPADPLHEVLIREHKKDRSLAQNSLYWLWLTLIAGELGETKDEMHHRYKKEILVHIYERDDPDYATMIESIRKIHGLGMKEDAQHLADQIVKLTSTRDANTEQFTEYLNDIEKDVLEIGIILPHPEDRYYEAMGIKI